MTVKPIRPSEDPRFPRLPKWARYAVLALEGQNEELLADAAVFRGYVTEPFAWADRASTTPPLPVLGGRRNSILLGSEPDHAFRVNVVPPIVGPHPDLEIFSPAPFHVSVRPVAANVVRAQAVEW